MSLPANTPPSEAPTSTFTPLKIALIYAAVAVLWSTFSDIMMTAWITRGDFDQDTGFVRLLTFKDWFFILVTAAMLYGFVHRAARTLRASEQRFRDFTEAASDWSWETDESLRFTYLSERFYELTRIPPERVLGRTRWEMATDYPGPAAWNQHRQTMEDHLPFRDFVYKIALRGEQDQTHYFKISGKPVFGPGNEFLGYRGTGSDISVRMRAEQEATRVRLYLRNIIDSMPSILVVVDPEGRITEWNRAAEQYSGIGRREAEDHYLPEVFPELAALQTQIDQAIRQGEPVVSRRRQGEDGRRARYVDIMIYPLLAGGMLGVVIRIDDVSAQVRYEQMLVENEKMLSIGGLAAGMAHELNNPLGAILQHRQNILRRLSPRLYRNREVAEELGLDLQQLAIYLERREIDVFLEGIHEAGSRAAKIINDMLSFSRHHNAGFTETSVEELLNTAARLATNDYTLNRSQPFQRIHLERQFDPSLSTIRCDPTEIQQVLLNLLKNAAQALRGIEHPSITLRTSREAGFARIQVIDNGPGMDEDTRKRIFEPFFTTKAVGQGTGLGLSVSYFIVTEQHQGRLSVRSEPGQGACFTVLLPISD